MKEKLALSSLDKICNSNKDAKEITKLIKQNGKVVGYEIANEFDVTVSEAISLAEQGHLKNIGIAHNKSTKYLKSIPDTIESNNLSSLPTKTK